MFSLLLALIARLLRVVSVDPALSSLHCPSSGLGAKACVAHSRLTWGLQLRLISWVCSWGLRPRHRAHSRQLS